MAWNERAKHDDLDLFQEQEADGSDALNDDTFGDASPVGDDWQPSAAQEAFHRELQQARNSPSMAPDEGLGIGPPPGLGSKRGGQEPRAAPQRGRGPRDPRYARESRDPRQTAFEALRSLGLENPPSLLGQPPPAGLFDGLSSLPRGSRPDLGPAYPRPNPMLGAKGWPCAAAAAAAPTAPPPFPRPDLLGRFSHFPRPDAIPQQLAALAALRRMAPPPAPPTPARQTIMSVTELEAQMMADQVPRPPSPLASLGLGPPGPPPPMAHKMSRGPGITSTRPPGLTPRPPGPPPGPPGPPGPPREAAPIPSFLDSLLVEPDEPAAMPLSPGAYPETRKWISPFTDKHREAVLDGTGSLSKQILEPFLQSESSGRQHVGLMTASDKELIVRIQLGQLASIGEMEPQRDAKGAPGDPGDHGVAQGEHLESGHGSAEVADRSFGALRASVHHSRASVDVTSTDLPAELENQRRRDALPAGLLEVDDGPMAR